MGAKIRTQESKMILMGKKKSKGHGSKFDTMRREKKKGIVD
jgi:hypothetical protein